jgi:hypothetical protein
MVRPINRICQMLRLKKLSLVFLSLLSFKAHAQYQKSALELQTDSVVAALHNQRVDTICITESYCVGCVGSRIKDDSPCATKGMLSPTHIFWKKGSATFASYLDNCSKRETVEINESAFWKYLLKNQQRIATEKIRHFTVNDNGKLERIHRNHGMKYSYTFFIGKDTINQYFDSFDLVRKVEFGDSKARNFYYKTNNKNPIRKIIPLLRQAVMEADKKWGINQS